MVVSNILVANSTYSGDVGMTDHSIEWTGYYGGINAGYTISNSKQLNVISKTMQYCSDAQDCHGGLLASSASAAGATHAFSLYNENFIGGGQFGYNFNINKKYIMGLEADIQGTVDANQSKSNNSVIDLGFGQSDFTYLSVSKAINYLGTVRGRLGYLLRPTILISGVGGLAYGGVSSNTTINQSYGNPGDTNEITTNWGTVGNYSATRLGWNTGGSIEWMFRSHWSAKIEYLYYDLGTVTYRSKNLINAITVPYEPQNYFTNSVNTTTQFNGQIARVGLNYHFS